MNSSGFGTIIQIGDILVSEEVVSEYFACDYPVCKGACCIEGDAGAPLEEDETARLEADYPRFSAFMTEDGRSCAEQSGFFGIDPEGDIVTPCVKGSSECAYCSFRNSPQTHGASGEGARPACGGSAVSSGGVSEGRSVLCAIELAGCAKPVSCSLYPIRVSKMPGGGLALNLHRWKICAPAYAKGAREGIRVYQFLKKPLINRFGADFYEALSAAAEHILPL